ncbi:MAG: hypothetical protein WDM77_01675 [Steroidobacteraceae bacterium]
MLATTEPEIMLAENSTPEPAFQDWPLEVLPAATFPLIEYVPPVTFNCCPCAAAAR